MVIDLDVIVLILSLVMFIAQLAAWRWAIGIRKALYGEIGSDLAGVIAGILGWTLVARAVGIVGLFIFQQTDLTDPALAASIVGQVIGGAVFVWAAWRIYRLRKQPPVDRPSEAVVELDAQPTAQVPPPTDNVGTPVDDGGDHVVAMP